MASQLALPFIDRVPSQDIQSEQLTTINAGQSMQPHVSRMTVYPMKSCDGQTLQKSVVQSSGALRHDRQFAMVDAFGLLINAKRTARIHQLRLIINPEDRTYSVARRDSTDEMSGQLDEDSEQLSDWLSDFFALDVSIQENDETGFPDDLDAPGPTVVSTATLQKVASWFPALTIDEVRHRFRANIEIDGVEAFWEDRLCRADHEPQPFRIGDVLFGGTNPCQRCVVPTRDSRTGEITPPLFAKTFAERRKESLPPWASVERFDHFYRLTTNTKLLKPGSGEVHIGDAVEVFLLEHFPVRTDRVESSDH